MKLYCLYILAIYSVLLVHDSQAQSSDGPDDPFGVDESELLPPEPREAVYWRGKDREEKNEIIVRSLLNVHQPLENLPLVTQGLTELPQTQKTDKVYNISVRFPNCDGEQWVYYNDTSDYLIANASHRLKASVNGYVSRVELAMPIKMRISATYLIVDRKVPLTLEAIKNSEYRRVMSFSGNLRSGEVMKLGRDEQQITTEVVIFEGGQCVSLNLNLYREGELDVEVATSLQVGVMKVIHVGITEVDEKGVMIINIEGLDMNGRVMRGERAPPKIEISKYEVSRKIINGSEYLFWKVPDLIQLLGPGPEKLVVNPGLGFFHEDAITFDFKEVMAYQGLRFGEDEWVMYDSVSGLMVASGSSGLLDWVEELTNELCVTYGISISTVTNFYEVDAGYQLESDGKWDVLRVLSSKPVLLGSVGYILGSGEMIRHGSADGVASLELIMDETGWMTEQSYQMNLDFEGCKIISDLKIDVLYDKPTFIALQADSKSQRTIIMKILTTKNRIYR
jgi:hypothetical protein